MSTSCSTLRTFKLLLAYDGTDFAGWQFQPGLRTVQGELEKLLKAITRARVVVVGSGRTDAGVHALGQVAVAREVAWPVTAQALKRALSMRLPADISLIDCDDIDEGFHPIRMSNGKRYEYRIRYGGIPDPFVHRYVWQIPYPLNVTTMCAAAKHLIGKHDFCSFQTSGQHRRTTVRTIRRLDLIERELGTYGHEIVVGIEADGFLYNMVRNIVGTLIEVGRGKQPPEWVAWVLKQQYRMSAGPTAPPHGLNLVRVDFPVEIFTPAQVKLP